MPIDRTCSVAGFNFGTGSESASLAESRSRTGSASSNLIGISACVILQLIGRQLYRFKLAECSGIGLEGAHMAGAAGLKAGKRLFLMLRQCDISPSP